MTLARLELLLLLFNVGSKYNDIITQETQGSIINIIVNDQPVSSFIVNREDVSQPVSQSAPVLFVFVKISLPLLHTVTSEVHFRHLFLLYYKLYFHRICCGYEPLSKNNETSTNDVVSRSLIQ